MAHAEIPPAKQTADSLMDLDRHFTSKEVMQWDFIWTHEECRLAIAGTSVIE
ncbi:hypothetical protein OAE97_03095 [Verrucomicrobia bacterium]|nr:hypothetical protein [Verrucomicrobiota bacterium]MDC0268114.1 hypothetical protein [bacterium]MDG1893181.1 hypothetical protein [Verrucomicrobiota bacterium]